jgi:hypothetical protein
LSEHVVERQKRYIDDLREAENGLKGIPAFPGAREVSDRLGRWPSFHDAEVTELDLRRGGESRLVLMLADAAEPSGRIQIAFTLKGVVGLELTEFNEQNVLGSLDVEREAEVTVLRMWPCYGLSGWIKARSVSVRLLGDA